MTVHDRIHFSMASDLPCLWKYLSISLYYPCVTNHLHAVKYNDHFCSFHLPLAPSRVWKVTTFLKHNLHLILSCLNSWCSSYLSGCLSSLLCWPPLLTPKCWTSWAFFHFSTSAILIWHLIEILYFLCSKLNWSSSPATHSLQQTSKWIIRKVVVIKVWRSRKSYNIWVIVIDDFKAMGVNEIT